MPANVAEAMMRSIPPTGWGDVATRNDLNANTTLLRGEMAEVRGEMAEVRGEMAEVRGEVAILRGEMAMLRGEIDIRFSHTNRTIVLAAVATVVSSWGATFAALGLG